MQYLHVLIITIITMKHRKFTIMSFDNLLLSFCVAIVRIFKTYQNGILVIDNVFFFLFFGTVKPKCHSLKFRGKKDILILLLSYLHLD